MFPPHLNEQVWGVRSNALGGLRLMILGESHYHDQPRFTGQVVPTLTPDAVRDHGVLGYSNFFSRLMQLVDGRRWADTTPTERQAFWDAVLFYNYVPVVVGTQSKQRPAEDMWRDGAAPFLRLLEERRPEIILVCGYDLWSHMVPGVPGLQDTPWVETATPHLEKPVTTRVIAGAPTLRIAHPSSVGFSVKAWQPIVADFLAQAKAEA
jgi:hypothetical protein